MANQPIPAAGPAYWAKVAADEAARTPRPVATAAQRQQLFELAWAPELTMSERTHLLACQLTHDSAESLGALLSQWGREVALRQAERHGGRFTVVGSAEYASTSVAA